MPSVESAFSEAMQHSQNPAAHDWAHEAVREAGRATGWFDMAQASSEAKIRALRAVFVKQYDALVNRVMAGEAVESRALVGHDGQLTPAQLAERNGREQAAAEAEAQYGRRMSADQGIAALRALTQQGRA